MGYYGELKADTVWRDQVELEGDLVVPRGKTLRLLPGTRLSSQDRPRWSCSVFRSAPEGYPIEASYRNRCDIVVLGRLEICGTRQEPVTLGTGPPPGTPDALRAQPQGLREKEPCPPAMATPRLPSLQKS